MKRQMRPVQSTQSQKSNNIEAIYPLTPVQGGMLFHSLLDPESGVYVEQFECIFRGKFDVTAFEQAWQQVVNRHAILRTGFFWERVKKPHQIVSRRLSVSLDQRDWRGLSSKEQDDRWEALLIEDRRQGFNLTTAPLMHLVLGWMEENRYQFLWSFHHILLDGWSIPLLLRELFAYYKAFTEGQDLHLESPRPYRDYVAWLQRQDLAKAEAYWREQLAGFTTPTLLADDRDMGDQPTGCAKHPLVLPASTTSALRTLARQQRLTLNTLVQGAWALLLNRYTRLEDVVFAIVVSGRPAELAGVESMVGMFLNTLLVRVKLSPDARLSDWLQALQAQNVILRQYEHTPLREILGWSDIPRYMPLCDSLLVFENYPTDFTFLEQMSHDLEISNFQQHEQDNYHVTLTMREVGIEIKGFLEYNTGLFTDTIITQMLEHLKTLLRSIAARPNARLMDLPLLSEAEQQQLLVAWNTTQGDYPHSQCIHQLFEVQAKKTPDATAVMFGNISVTYAELNARVNQLGWYLRDLGVGPDVLVAICVERSLEMAVGLLGILKAGGAYVPLDPTYPKERLAFMLADSEAAILLTQQRLLETLPTSDDARAVCLDTEWNVITQYSQKNPANHTQPENLAYVIYTSGSTGQPKGVTITHRSMVNHNVAVTRAFNLRPDDQILQFASLSFDTAVEELFPSWLVGASVVLFPHKTLVSGKEFLQLIEKEKVTVLDLPTAYWRQWAHELSVSNDPLPASLRLVVVGGEKVSAESFKDWQSTGETTRWINTYGPTETTVIATLYEHTRGESNGGGSFTPPIGRPIANIRAYILDAHLSPVPIGIPGELHLGGVGLARGYLNRPELTAEKFIPDPFSKERGSRLYQTGDLTRYLPDGNIEFLGRVDHQVKIRGFRIEPEEVEAALGQHEAVREAVVIAREDGAVDQRLVAYVVPHKGRSSEISQLRGFLGAKLPQYMVPSAFVMLHTLPFTPSGKVDRKALPTLGGQVQRTTKYVSPRNQTEKVLVDIFADVLDVEQVGVLDNFFQLGGHSLLAIQLMGQIRAAFVVDLPLRSLFEVRTVAEFAEVIDKAKACGPGSEKSAVLPVLHEANLAKKPAQGETASALNDLP